MVVVIFELTATTTHVLPSTPFVKGLVKVLVGWAAGNRRTNYLHSMSLQTQPYQVHITVYQIDFFALRPLFLLRSGVFSLALGRGARMGPACTPQSKCGPSPKPVGRALGPQSREFWQITRGHVPT